MESCWPVWPKTTSGFFWRASPETTCFENIYAGGQLHAIRPFLPKALSMRPDAVTHTWLDISIEGCNLVILMNRGDLPLRQHH